MNSIRTLLAGCAFTAGALFLRVATNRSAPISRIPFPAQAVSRANLTEKTWSAIPYITSGTAVAVFAYIVNPRNVNDEQAAGLKQLANLSHGISDIDTLDEYMELAFELRFKGRDRKYLDEVWENVGKAYLKACEKGDTDKIGRITSYIEVRDAKLPDLNLSRIPHDSLHEIVDRLLDREVKKVTVEDFEWALLHKNYELYEILLGYLESDKRREQLAISKLSHWDTEGRKFEHAFDAADKIYASYECILDHPRIRPYREIARVYHDQHEQRLRQQCQKEIIEIQELLNSVLETQLSVEELCQKSVDRTLEFECRKRGTIILADAQDHMILLKQLLETNDTSSLHWLSVKRHFWKPPASGVAGWC